MRKAQLLKEIDQAAFIWIWGELGEGMHDWFHVDHDTIWDTISAAEKYANFTVHKCAEDTLHIGGTRKDLSKLPAPITLGRRRR